MGGFRDTTKTMSGHSASPLYKATGGTINRLAGGGHFRQMTRPPELGSQGEDKQNGLLAHGTNAPTGNSAVQRSPVQSTQALQEHGGKSELMPGYAKGGKPKVFHAHNHYHNGKKMPGKSKLRKMEMMAEKKATGGTIDKFATGGTINRLAKGGKARTTPPKAGAGHIERDLNPNVKPNFAKGGKAGTKPKQVGAGHVERDLTTIAPNFRKGGKMRKATGGTINKVATGGTIDKFGAGGAMYKKGGKAC